MYISLNTFVKYDANYMPR